MENRQKMLDDLMAAIVGLVVTKDRHYGSEWREDESLSAMMNTVRKLRRLRAVWTQGWKSESGDTRIDTLVDLLNYCILTLTLHSELDFDVFEKELMLWEGGHMESPHVYSGNTTGFRQFVEDRLAPKARKCAEDHRTLEQLIQERILPRGTASIEGWVKATASIVKSGTGDLSSCIFSSQYQVEQLLGLLVPLVLAILRHAQACPEEWARFLKEWSPSK